MVVEKEVKPLLRLKDVARRLDVDEKTIRRWLNDGKIEGSKLVGRWRFEEAEITRLVHSQRRARDKQVPRVKRKYVKRKAA